MSDEFSFHVTWLGGPQGGAIEQSTFGEISIRSANEVLTTLEDSFSFSVRGGVRGDAYSLARWFVENWWRLRWEPDGNTADWRLAHVLAAAGGGVAWPAITLASDGTHVLVRTRHTSFGKGAPIRYLYDFDMNIGAHAFEEGLDRFMQLVLARLSALGLSGTPLDGQWTEVLAERRDPSRTALRKLEALLGFDPDEAPSALIDGLMTNTAIVGDGAVHEIAAAEKGKALETLKETMDGARASDLRMRIKPIGDRLSQLLGPSNELPWQRAQTAARLVRDAWAISSGPVPDSILCDVLSIPRDVFTVARTGCPPIAAGLRKDPGTDEVGVVMRSSAHSGRRFEMMRLVADHFASEDDRLLPVTPADTYRQKFQRAFAQEFLLPFEELNDRLGRPRRQDVKVEDDDMEQIARDYDVSPLMVSTILVNKGLLPRAVLSNMTTW